MHYRGRFAPSPTGGLHMGSLVSALASFLDAHAAQGEWLIRMEDIDPPREQDGAAELILASLQRHHLSTPSAIVFQSEQSERYIQAIKQLWQQGELYLCICSSKRIKQLHAEKQRCSCREKPLVEWYEGALNHCEGALRLKVRDAGYAQNSVIRFEDRHYGVITQNIAEEVGDFIIRRSDGLFAYQLAVVVDDAWQGISDVVRGADLLSVTPRQIYLQKVLGFETPRYRHVPLVYDEEGNKLSKQHFSPVLDDTRVLFNLCRACEYLSLSINSPKSAEDLLSQALDAWGKM